MNFQNWELLLALVETRSGEFYQMRWALMEMRIATVTRYVWMLGKLMKVTHHRRLERSLWASSDTGLTPKAVYQRAMSVQQAPVLGFLQLKDPSFSSPRSRRGLGHSVTAPPRVRRNLFPENDDVAFSRSMTKLW